MNDFKSTIWIINQYASTPLTGIGGRHRHLARELADRGHKVYVVAARWTHTVLDDDAADSAPFIERFEGFRFVRISVPKYANSHDKRRVLSWILFALKVSRLDRLGLPAPDVVLCSSPSLMSFVGAEYIARKYNARLIFEVRDIWPLSLMEIGGYSKNNLFIKILQWIEDRAYRNADKVVSNLPFSVDHMVMHGMDKEKFTWIPNGFSLKEIAASSEYSFHDRWDISSEAFVVGYAGTVGVANALGTVIDAAEILKEENVCFVILGNGKEKARLQSEVSKRLLSNVRFIDGVPKQQVQSVLKCFDVCYLGLRNDPLFRFGVSPNKLFDYFISGKPIIYAIDSGQYRPVFESGAGIHVPPEDPSALADAVLNLRSKTVDERRAMGERGRNFAINNHEYEKLAEALEHVLLN